MQRQLPSLSADHQLFSVSCFFLDTIMPQLYVPKKGLAKRGLKELILKFIFLPLLPSLPML
ncbi:MAG: hypothetical protein PUC49_08070 [Clostridiales bacterium]|nr:hypothetical protein [Clostridiales bacterium]